MLAYPNFCTRIKHRKEYFRRLVCAAGLIFFVVPGFVDAKTVAVDVGPGLFFNPKDVDIDVGYTVVWTWKGNTHSVTEGTPGNPTGFDSGVLNTGATFQITFTDPGTVDYYCDPHGLCCGMVGTVTVVGGTPTPPPTPTPTPTPIPSP